jgi:TolA-binding protein
MVGRCRYRSQEFAQAATILAPVSHFLERNDRYARDALYYLGRALYRDHRFEGAMVEFVLFQERYFWDSRDDDARFYMARSHEELGDLDGAEAVFDQLLSDPTTGTTLLAGATYRMGKLMRSRALAAAPAESDSLFELAHEWLMNVLFEYPDSPYVDNAAYAQAKLPYDRAGLASPQMAAPLYAQAQSELDVFQEDYPESSLVPGAIYTQGRILYTAKAWSEALAYFLEVLARGESPWTDNSLYYAGMSHYHLGSNVGSAAYDAAIDRFEQLLSGYSDSIYLDNAAYFRGRSLMKVPRLTEAAAAFTSFREDYPESSYLDNALYQLTLVWLTLGNCPAASESLGALLAQEPPSSYAGKAEASVSIQCELESL